MEFLIYANYLRPNTSGVMIHIKKSTINYTSNTFFLQIITYQYNMPMTFVIFMFACIFDHGIVR